MGRLMEESSPPPLPLAETPIPSTPPLVPVELMDERLTTREAKDRLRSAKENLISVSADTHQISAQIILESWFSESR